MVSFSRSALTDFDFGNPLYAGATVSAFTIDGSGNITAVLATLYADLTSATLLANPQALDGNGQWQQPVYINTAVILKVTGVNGVPDHQTGVISANLAGTSATDAATSAGAAQASFGMASVIAERVRTLYNKIKVQGLPGGLVALNMLRVNAVATGYELRTIGQVRGDIGLPAAIGASNYLKSNAGATAYVEQAVATVRSDVGLPAIAAASAGYDLSFDSAGSGFAPTGPMAGFKSRVINGDHRIAQRSTSVSVALATTGYNTLDRFGSGIAVTSAVVTEAQGADHPIFGANGFCWSHAVTTADASVTAGKAWNLRHRIEGYNVYDIIGQGKATLVFWVKSPKAGIHCVAFGSVGGDRNFLVEYTVIAANAWERKVITVDFTTANVGGTWNYTSGIGLQISWPLMAGLNFQGAANAWQAGNLFATANQQNLLDTNGNVFKIADVMFVAGSNAPAFERRPIGIELPLCQRYYAKTFRSSVAPAAGLGYTGDCIMGKGAAAGDSEPFANWFFPVIMRAAPTITLFNQRPAGAAGQWSSTTADTANTRVTFLNENHATIDNTGQNSGSAGSQYEIAAAASAEL